MHGKKETILINALVYIKFYNMHTDNVIKCKIVQVRLRGEEMRNWTIGQNKWNNIVLKIANFISFTLLISYI